VDEEPRFAAAGALPVGILSRNLQEAQSALLGVRPPICYLR
jgi:hypothetical protein